MTGSVLAQHACGRRPRPAGFRRRGRGHGPGLPRRAADGLPDPRLRQGPRGGQVPPRTRGWRHPAFHPADSGNRFHCVQMENAVTASAANRVPCLKCRASSGAFSPASQRGQDASPSQRIGQLQRRWLPGNPSTQGGMILQRSDINLHALCLRQAHRGTRAPSRPEPLAPPCLSSNCLRLMLSAALKALSSRKTGRSQVLEDLRFRSGAAGNRCTSLNPKRRSTRIGMQSARCALRHCEDTTPRRARRPFGTKFGRLHAISPANPC